MGIFLTLITTEKVGTLVVFKFMEFLKVISAIDII